jgi:hypothetical protein
MLGSMRRLEAQVNTGGVVEFIPEKNDSRKAWFSFITVIPLAI